MSSEKSARSSQKKRIQNRSIRSATRTAVAAAVNTVNRGEKDLTGPAVTRAIRSLDKAATRGIIHPNNAARRKSRLMKRLNSLASEG